jgi:hypothetical protein
MWEAVYRSDNEVMERTAVDGGWLYRYQLRQGSEHGGFSWSIAMAFVPTPAPPPP